MIFDHIRTRRLSVQPIELTLEGAGDILALPGERHERVTTELLRRIASRALRPTEGHVSDPLLWTVQERGLVVARYIAQVAEDGPDFSIGEDAHLTDYLDLTKDLPAGSFDLGVVAAFRRVYRPLLGVHAEVLESRCKTRGQWVLGAMACQLFKDDEEVPDWLSMPEVDLLVWIDDRIKGIKRSGESYVAELLAAWDRGNENMAHFFVLAFDDNGSGIVFLPKERGEAGAELPAARFQPVSCVSTEAKFLSS